MAVQIRIAAFLQQLLLETEMGPSVLLQALHQHFELAGRNIAAQGQIKVIDDIDDKMMLAVDELMPHTVMRAPLDESRCVHEV